MAVFSSSERWKFVGLETIDANAELPVGSYATETGFTQNGIPKSIGRATSSYFSPVLNRTIALGLVERGSKRKNEVINFMVDDGIVEVKIVNSVFYDPEGTHFHA